MSDTTKKTKSVRLSPTQITALTTLARQDRRDVSDIIRIAIDELIEKGGASRPAEREVDFGAALTEAKG